MSDARSRKARVRLFAFYLPQFHDCPFNSKWWGPGFTEWTNVRKATPLFDGHLQPRVPAGGYYDLGNPSVVESQFKRARDAGLDGFVLYHYWYKGLRPLGLPLNGILRDKSLRVRFSLCWANHSWTRSWKNRAGAMDVLIEQEYERTADERKEHIDFLVSAFCDERYIRVQGRPLFQIYLPENITHLEQFVHELREQSRLRLSTEIHLSAMITGWRADRGYLSQFDSCTLSQPTLALYGPQDVLSTRVRALRDRTSIAAIVRSLPVSMKKVLYPIQDRLFNKAEFFDYDTVWSRLHKQFAESRSHEMQVFASAFVDFDNTPRYGSRAKIIRGFSPQQFGDNLRKLISASSEGDADSIVFINAWNEWGEGMYLEDDAAFQNARLAEIRKATNSSEYE